MKKALFKPNSKVFENFEYSKLQDMLLKKVNYFHKTYIRYLKRLYGETDNSKIYDLIKNDIVASESMGDRFKLTSDNLSEKVYNDADLKTLMIVDFFRALKGRNPFMKEIIQADKLDMYLSQNAEDGDNANATSKSDLNSEYQSDYLNFNDLTIQDKVEVLFFFCK